VSRSVDNGLNWTDAVPLNNNAGSGWGANFGAQVVTDQAGHWIAVWLTYDTLDGTIGADRDILIAHSFDNGVTWTDQTPLNRNATSDIGDDWYPQVATDGAGNWVAVWESADSLNATIGSDWDILVARSANHGFTWSAPAPLNTYAYTDTTAWDKDAQIAADGVGNWVAVWTSNVNPDGSTGIDNDILAARSVDNGLTWTDPAPVNSYAGADGGTDETPRVATDGAGNWVAVWTSYESMNWTIGTDADILVSRVVGLPPPVDCNGNGLSDDCDIAAGTSHDCNGNGVLDECDLVGEPGPLAFPFADPVPLNNNAGSDGDEDDDYFPQVVTDGAGHWVAIWDSEDDQGGTIGTDFDILVARSTDGGQTWTDPAPLNNNARHDSGTDRYARLTTDGTGVWVAVWMSQDSLGGTIGTDDDILTARSLDNGVTWSDPVLLNSSAATDTGEDWAPQVTTDGAGHWVAVWWSEDELGLGLGTDADILVARSTNGGADWTVAAPLNSNAATDFEDDWSPQVTTDGAGNWVAVWQTADDDIGTPETDDWDIAVARSVDNGATWTDPAKLNNNCAGYDGFDVAPQLTTDGQGNWIAVWESLNDLSGTIGTDYDIVVARSVDLGVSWTDPVALNNNAATDSGSDRQPQLATDDAGNWVAVWYSDEELGAGLGPDLDILAAHSVDAGVSWTDPVPLNSNAAVDARDDGYARLTVDADGNWLATWFSEDDLGGTIGDDSDILIARVPPIPPVSWDCNGNGVPDECDDVAGGDFDASGFVDALDFAHFDLCMAGPDAPPTVAEAHCIALYLAAFDMDGQLDVDVADFAVMQIAP
jgi:hypothetical protein